MTEVIILLVSVISSACIGGFVFARNPNLTINRLYAALTLSLVLFPVANYFSLHSDHRLFFIRLVIAISSVAVALLYYLIKMTAKSSPTKSPWFKASLYLTILIVILDFTPLVFSGLNGTVNPTPVPNYGAVLFFAHLLLFPLYSIGLLIKRIRVTRGTSRQQNQFMLAGLIPILCFAPITAFILPVIYKNSDLISLSPLYVAFFVFFIGYAIIKHRLFDIRFYAVRGATYAITILFLGTLYIAPAVYIMAIVIMGFDFNLAKFVIGVAFATIAAFNFGLLRNWFDRMTSRIFFRETYDSTDVLAELNRLLVSTIVLRSMVEKSTELIMRHLNPGYCTFIFKNPTDGSLRYIGSMPKKITPQQMYKVEQLATLRNDAAIVTDYMDDKSQQLKQLLTKNDIACLIRLSDAVSSHSSVLGFVVMGYKKNGNSYNNQDVRLLEAMADVLSLAIQNALRFEEIQNFNITLQRQVDDATGELRRTNAKLVALDETKDDFISMASHQLRTPLTAVKGYLSMVLDGDAGAVSPMQQKMLGQAFASSQRMVYLISDLLNVSRLKTGKFVIERTEVDLAHLIDQEIGQLKLTAASHSLSLAYKKPRNFPLLKLDETKTRQVVMNFIDNAIHYTPAGGHIVIELLDKSQTVELVVRDDGIGVPKSEQHHLFTKFYRALNARRQRPDGTGLGLFMAKKVIVAQGGAVVFNSQENKGSTFGFTLPKHKLLVAKPPK